MLAFIRTAFFGLIVLTVLFWLVRIYARSLRREALETRWEAAQAKGRAHGTRAAFVEKGMRRYDKGLLRRLVWLVYILPITLVALIVYLVNYT